MQKKIDKNKSKYKMSEEENQRLSLVKNNFVLGFEKLQKTHNTFI